MLELADGVVSVFYFIFQGQLRSLQAENVSIEPVNFFAVLLEGLGTQIFELGHDFFSGTYQILLLLGL